ncbi:MAG: hypothetical protein R3D63_00100 [Paracoccaceae bacterium]
MVFPIAGLLLPPRYSLRLGAAGVVAVLALPVFDSAPADPDWGFALFWGSLWILFLAYFGAVVIGLALRRLWRWRHGVAPWSFDLSAPLADRALVFLAMALPAGIMALWLGSLLSGDTSPLRTHLLLLAGLAGLALSAALPVHGLVRAAVLGFAGFAALIVADSMRLDGQIQAQLPTDAPYCLAIGPDRLPRDQSPPLMGLTAPKPILRVVAGQNRPETRRWSFRWHGFVRDGSGNPAPPCTPAPP